MADVEIGIGKTGRRAYGFDDIAIVPSRRTRDPEDVDTSWEIDAFRFELPILASPADSVVSPATSSPFMVWPAANVCALPPASASVAVVACAGRTLS